MTENLLSKYIDETLADLSDAGLFRSAVTSENPPERIIFIDGKEYINAASNNTLGLAGNQLLCKAAAEAAKKWGAGGGASRLVCGELGIHRELELRLAEFKGCEDAAVFTSGYMTNVGVISALCDEKTCVVMDKLCHASIIDGVKLSGSRLRTYPHCDLERLEKCLQKTQNQKTLVITDSVFSMDGDIAPLKEIVELCEKYGAMIMVDEAHATGVLGEKCSGAVEMLGLKDRIQVQMGTLSKAIGSQGGYVAGDKKLIDFIKNKARSYIYTTSPAPAAIGAAIAALDYIEENPAEAKKALNHAQKIWDALKNAGYEVGCPSLPDNMPRECQTHIIPVVVGSVEDTMTLSRKLRGFGVFAPAIRPPTVKPGTSRIRLSVMSTHTEEDISRIISAFAQK